MVGRPGCTQMDISVVIPVHNGGDAFRRCLDGLVRSTVEPIEIIVVPDGESDGSWRIAEQYDAHILDPGPEARGPAHARNRGADIARGELLLFIDADVIVHEECLQRIVNAFEADDALDALIGSYDDEPDHPGFLSQYRNLLHHYVHQTSQPEASTFWGACGAVRRDLFMEVGGFNDVRFPRPSVEDIELGYRLQKAGARIRLDGTVQVKHLKKWTGVSILKTDFFCRGIPWSRLIHEHDALENNLNLRTESRISVALSGILPLSLCLMPFWGPAWIPALLSALLLLALNFPLYRFFQQKRGILFMLGVIPWHWLFYFYSGVAYVVGTIKYLLYGDSSGTAELLPT